MIWKIVIVT